MKSRTIIRVHIKLYFPTSSLRSQQQFIWHPGYTDLIMATRYERNSSTTQSINPLQLSYPTTTSSFFVDETVALKADPAIIGIVSDTWSEVDTTISEPLNNCYIHHGLPAKVRKAWFEDEKLSPGYVIIGFAQDYDGFCLVPRELTHIR